MRNQTHVTPCGNRFTLCRSRQSAVPNQVTAREPGRRARVCIAGARRGGRKTKNARHTPNTINDMPVRRPLRNVRSPAIIPAHHQPPAFVSRRSISTSGTNGIKTRGAHGGKDSPLPRYVFAMAKCLPLYCLSFTCFLRELSNLRDPDGFTVRPSLENAGERESPVNAPIQASDGPPPSSEFEPDAHPPPAQLVN